MTLSWELGSGILSTSGLMVMSPWPLLLEHQAVAIPASYLRRCDTVSLVSGLYERREPWEGEVSMKVASGLQVGIWT
jgi:hypothetical protein